jgi:hypothetical protein
MAVLHMAIESTGDVFEPFKSQRNNRLSSAATAVTMAVDDLDYALRGTRSARARTLVATVYKVLAEQKDLIRLAEQLEAEDETQRREMDAYQRSQIFGG